MHEGKQHIQNDVLAVMRSENDVMEAVVDLERQGFERDGIRVIHPEEAPQQIDAQGKRSGVLTKIAKHIQSALSDENELLEEYEEAAGKGAEVIAVHVRRPEEVEVARDILQSHNGENIRHFGSWQVSDLEGQGRAST